MLSKDKLNRINFLSRKAKDVGLTTAEKDEQYELRQEYLNVFRNSMTDTLHSVKILDPKGNDVTPKKLQESKKNKNKKLH